MKYEHVEAMNYYFNEGYLAVLDCLPQVFHDLDAEDMAWLRGHRMTIVTYACGQNEPIFSLHPRRARDEKARFSLGRQWDHIRFYNASVAKHVRSVSVMMLFFP